MNTAFPAGFTPPAQLFSGAVTIPERRAVAVANAAALAVANPRHAERITQATLSQLATGKNTPRR